MRRDRGATKNKEEEKEKEIRIKKRVGKMITRTSPIEGKKSVRRGR